MPSFAERVRLPIQAKSEGGTAALARRRLQAPAPEAAAPALLPEPLRSAAETLGGFSLVDVRVHRNSAEPAKLGALAYTKGTDIHLGPGQERHLPHEAWHVVQQKQGRVAATTQMKRPGVGQDEELEAEADEMADQLESAAEFEPLEDEADSLDDQAAAELDETELPLSSDDENEALVDVGENAPDTRLEPTQDDVTALSSDYFTPDHGPGRKKRKKKGPKRKERKKKDQLDCKYEEKSRHSKGGFEIVLPVLKLGRKPTRRPINIDLQIPFNPDSDQPLPLTPAATTTLNRIVNILTANPGATASVSGSTRHGRGARPVLTLGGVQRTGTSTQLADARSTALINILVGIGAPAAQLATGPPQFESTLSARVTIAFAGSSRLRLSFKTKRVRVFKFITGKSFYAKAQQKKNKALSKQRRKLANKRKRH